MTNASANLGIVISATSNVGQTLKSAASDVQASASQIVGHVDKIGGSLKHVGEIAAGVFLGGALHEGLNQLTGFFSGSAAAAKESAEVQAQLGAVLKSTNGAIGLTADQLIRMSQGFQKSTNFSDEAALSAENLLLTFGNIGKNVFPAATSAVLDMSQALGQDTKSSAIQLGKALNDPINGLTALRRVGVSFDDAQQKQIKTMVAAGNTAGAQRLILAELNKEFGGSAAAAVKADGGITQLKNKMNDLQEVIGAKMLPLQVKFQQAQLAVATVLVNTVIPAIGRLGSQALPIIQDLVERFKKLPAPIQAIISPIAAVVLHFSELKRSLTDVVNLFKLGFNGGQIGGQFSLIEKAAFGLGQVFKNTILPAFHDAEQAVHLFFLSLQGGSAGGNLSSLQSTFLHLGTQVRQSWLNDIKPALSAFQDIVKTVVKFIIEHWNTISTVFKLVADNVKEKIGGMLEVLKGVIEIVSGVIQGVDDAIHGRWNEVWEDFKKVVNGAVDVVIGYFREQFGVLGTILYDKGKAAGASFIKGLGEGLGDIGKSLLKGAVDLGSTASPPSLGGARAGGGSVAAYTPYLVGERGPEIFTPRTSGRIIPNNRISSFGSGGSVSNSNSKVLNIYGPVNINVPAGAPPSADWAFARI